MFVAREFHGCQEPLCWQRTLHKEHFYWILCRGERKKTSPCSQEKGEGTRPGKEVIPGPHLPKSASLILMIAVIKGLERG